MVPVRSRVNAYTIHCRDSHATAKRAQHAHKLTPRRHKKRTPQSLLQLSFFLSDMRAAAAAARSLAAASVAACMANRLVASIDSCMASLSASLLLPFLLREKPFSVAHLEKLLVWGGNDPIGKARLRPN